VCGGRPPQKKKKRKRKKRILKARAREYYFLGETTHTRERNTTMSTKFLGGMRGLTKFVEKIRNCANQVRARQSNSYIYMYICIYIRFLLGPDGRERAQKSRRGMKRERESRRKFLCIRSLDLSSFVLLNVHRRRFRDRSLLFFLCVCCVCARARFCGRFARGVLC
jgi:hypothetical protein